MNHIKHIFRLHYADIPNWAVRHWGNFRHCHANKADLKKNKILLKKY